MAPTPRTSFWAVFCSTLPAVGVPEAIAANTRNVAMRIRLLTIGVNIGGPKRPWALIRAAAIAAMPNRAI